MCALLFSNSVFVSFQTELSNVTVKVTLSQHMMCLYFLSSAISRCSEYILKIFTLDGLKHLLYLSHPDCLVFLF